MIIRLPDSSTKEFSSSPTGLQVAEAIGPRLAKEALGVVLPLSGPEVIDVRNLIPDGAMVRIITAKDPESLEVIRHSAAHVMAQAVQELWPEVKVTIGPVIENGFFYDFAAPFAFKPEDLQKIEDKMKELIRQDAPVVKEVWPVAEAVSVFSKLGENYKVEIIKDLAHQPADAKKDLAPPEPEIVGNPQQPEVSIYKQGKWFDLCRGPHVQRLGQIGAVKVLSLAGSYWRGDESKGRLQRIYATAFHSQKALDEHLHLLDEAKKRDHRKLGKDLDLFHFHPLSPGGPFFTPKGAIIYNELMGFLRSLYIKYGYQEVITPQLFDVELFRTSGHLANYRDNMYFTKPIEADARELSFKPMNCPGHCLLFSMDKRSYRELPLRVADFGRLHRFERSGVLHGLTRVRTFCQDDAHIFCRMDQLQSEIRGFMKLLEEIYSTLGMMEFRICLSTRPESRMGSDEIWDQAEGALKAAMVDLGLNFVENPGDGAFYGPKLDILFVDALKRPWQLGTLQVDFNLPNAFDLTFTGEDNREHRPVVLHRAVLGSLERFIGVFLEHCAGRLPLWLSPIQVAVLSVTDRQNEYCFDLANELKSLGLRVLNDTRGEKLGLKIRQAQLQQIPYMVVIGEKEVSEGHLTLRLLDGSKHSGVTREDFCKALKEETNSRRLRSPFVAH